MEKYEHHDATTEPKSDVDVDAARRGSLVAAVVGAAAASLCCLGPLVLGLVGIGGAGALAGFSRYRPIILGATAVLLAAGFWLTYRRRQPANAMGSDACECEQPRTAKSGRTALWVATVLVVVFVASPYVLARTTARSTQVPAVRGAVTDVISVQGMDCEACAGPIRRAVTHVGGVAQVDVDVERHRVVVRHEAQPGAAGRYVAAIEQLGYRAHVEGHTP